MLAQLHACHLASNSYLVGSVSARALNWQHRHQATRHTSTTPAAAARPVGRRGGSGHGDQFNGLGALLSSNQLPQAVELVQACLDSSQRVHGVKTAELLEALCAAGQHSTAWPLLRRITACKGRLPLQPLHRLLKLAGQFGTVDDVLAVYQHQQQLYGFASAGVQTTLIHALLKAHSRSQQGHLLAYEAWGRLKKSGKQLDAQSLLAGIHACVCVGKFRQAEALLEPLKAAAGAVGRPMVSAYNLLLKGHVSAGNLDAARRTFAAMASRGLAPDAVTYNTLLAGFARAGDMARAGSMLRSMQVEGIRPDAWTYTTLALGYGRLGQLQEMWETVRQMQQAGVAGNSAMYAAAIDALASTGQLQEAEHLLQQLVDNQGDILAALSSSSSSSSSPTGGSSSSSSSGAEPSNSGPHAAPAVQQGSDAAGLPLPPDAVPAPAANGAAVSPVSSSSSSHAGPNQQQRQRQQHQDIAASTRGRQQVLRQQYNSLIKGWLQVAAAQASEQAEQRWLASESGSGSSSSSSSSSGSSTPLAAPSIPSSRQEVRSTDWQPSSVTQAAGDNGRPQQQVAAAAAVLHTQQEQRVLLTAGAPQQQPRQQLALQQQPAARRVGVGLVRPVLPQPSPTSSVDDSGTLSSLAAAGGLAAAPSLQRLQHRAEPQPQQQQQALQQQRMEQADAAAAFSSSNGNGQPQAAAVLPRGPAAAGAGDPFGAAVAVMQQMQAAGVEPGADTYTLFVNHCIKVGDASMLQRMLDAASAAGVQPDQVLLTTLIKAAWKADAHAAAVDLFNALLRVTATPGRHTGSSSSGSSSGGSSSGAAAPADGSSVGSGGPAAVPPPPPPQPQQQQQQPSLQPPPQQQQQPPPQQQQQGRFSLAASLRSYAQAAGNSPAPSPSRGSTAVPATTAAAAAAGTSQPQQSQQPDQQASIQAQLEQQLQQQMAEARQQQQQQQQPPAGPDQSSGTTPAAQQPQPEQPQQQQRPQEPEQRQQPPRRSPGQLLLPLSAPVGPDTAAWNALVAALVRAEQLEDAAVALERSTQASAAAGASRPPVEGYSALLRGYRRAGLKHKAVGLLRQFLNLGGQPVRVMCDDVITLCLEARDLKTARQVVRAMELTGCLDAEGTAFYNGWFRRWELQQQQALLPPHLQQSSARSAAGARPGGEAGGQQQQQGQQQGEGAVSAPVAVERLKWWLGLPNKYYRGMEGTQDTGCTRD